MRKVKLGFGITTLIFVILILLLNLNPKFVYIARYTRPYCVKDNFVFETDVCEHCNKSIQESGMIKDLGIPKSRYDTPDTKYFRNLFSSLDDYKKTENIIIVECFAVVMCLISYVVFIILLIKEKKSNDKKKSSSAS